MMQYDRAMRSLHCYCHGHHLYWTPAGMSASMGINPQRVRVLWVEAGYPGAHPGECLPEAYVNSGKCKFRGKLLVWN